MNSLDEKVLEIFQLDEKFETEIICFFASAFKNGCHL